MTFCLSPMNAPMNGNIAEIYDLPSAFLAKTWLSARRKVFRSGKGKHHMVMHDDGREGNIMYLWEYKNGARTRSLFKDTLRILSRAPLIQIVFPFSFLSSQTHVKFTMRMHTSGCDLFYLYTRGINYKQRDERNDDPNKTTANEWDINLRCKWQRGSI